MVDGREPITVWITHTANGWAWTVQGLTGDCFMGASSFNTRAAAALDAFTEILKKMMAIR